MSFSRLGIFVFFSESLTDLLSLQLYCNWILLWYYEHCLDSWWVSTEMIKDVASFCKDRSQVSQKGLPAKSMTTIRVTVRHLKRRKVEAPTWSTPVVLTFFLRACYLIFINVSRISNSSTISVSWKEQKLMVLFSDKFQA